ncbi:hypothetical protein EDB92DRAFT_402066 [Lactarius akahatsu]|uniref:Uncharacterized protein n=1 Tax=Lactarius akahatsu TaxID=416441 RepID=A0AAD4QEG7_9AGAM|nr:hypothetical protein EDB92DRAFT_402066 [Lactarius akahatsu]
MHFVHQKAKQKLLYVVVVPAQVSPDLCASHVRELPVECAVVIDKPRPILHQTFSYARSHTVLASPHPPSKVPDKTQSPKRVNHPLSSALPVPRASETKSLNGYGSVSFHPPVPMMYDRRWNGGAHLAWSVFLGFSKGFIGRKTLLCTQCMSQTVEYIALRHVR